MIKYREILRLKAQNFSNRAISSSCGCSKNTVGDVLKRAEEKGVTWPLNEDVDYLDLQRLLFPEKNVGRIACNCKGFLYSVCILPHTRVIKEIG